MKKGITTLALLFFVSFSWSQESPKTLEECLNLARERNVNVKLANLSIEQAKLDRKALVPVPRTDISLMMGQYNSANKSDNNITIQQSIPFPTVFVRQKELAEVHLEQQSASLSVTQWQLSQQVRSLYEELAYLNARKQLFLQSDSLYTRLEKTVNGRQQAGDASRMEAQLTSVNKLRNVHQLGQIAAEILRVQVALQSLLHTTELIVPAETVYLQRTYLATGDSLNWQQLPPVRELLLERQMNEAETALLRAQRLPDLSLGYFNQTLIGTQTINGQEVVFTGQDRFQGFLIGTSVPIFDRSTKAKMQQSGLKEQQADLQLKYTTDQLRNEYESMKLRLAILRQQLSDWEQTAQPLLQSLEEQTSQSFREGETDLQWVIMNQQTILEYRLDYIDLLYQTNSIVNGLNSYTIQE